MRQVNTGGDDCPGERVGLDALVLTEHHIIWPQAELEALLEFILRVRLLRGVEVECAEGEDLLVYGVTVDGLLTRHMPGAEVARIAHVHGGFVTLAHPFRYKDTIASGLEALVDGVEVLSIHILNYGQALAQAYADKYAIRALAASDAHNTSSLGLYAVDLFRLGCQRTRAHRNLTSTQVYPIQR